MTDTEQERKELDSQVRGEGISRRDLTIGLIGLVVTIALAIVPFVFRDKLIDVTTWSNYGLVGTLIISFIAASAFSMTAIPVPYWAVTFTLPSMLAPHYGIMAPVWVALCTAVGASLAQFTTFLIGYTGRGFTDSIGKRFGKDFYELAIKWLRHNGGWAIFFMSVTTNPLHLPMTISIAALHYPPWSFLLFSFLGMLVKSMVLAFAGYYSLNFLLHLNENPVVITILAILASLVFIIIIWQLVVWSLEIREKNRKYKAAQAFAKKAGKQLLVIGGPWGALPFRRIFKKPAHEGGDVCLDVNPRALEGHSCPVVASVTDIPFGDKTFGAIFLSHVLEHLPTTGDAKKALSEMARVADSVFIVYPSRQSIGGWFTRDHHIWIWQDDKFTYLKQRGKTGKGEKSVVKTARGDVK